MATLPIYDRTGHKVGDYEIDPAEVAPRINKQLLHDAVVMYQANQRQGTHRTKSRSEVAGSTRKLYRQKGTGHARAGSRRSGIRRGGGHIFARRPRDYHYRMPRQSLQLATRMALAARIRDGEVALIDELSFESPATRDMAQILKAVGCDGISVHLATAGYDQNVYKSARNIEGVTVSPAEELNAFVVLRPRKLVLTKAAMDAIRERAGAKASAAASES